jgi:hypothetical protein
LAPEQPQPFEAAFRLRYPPKNEHHLPFHQLIERAINEARIDADNGELVEEAGRKLRNSFAHGKIGGPLTPAMLELILRATHAVVADLYPDNE